MGNKILRQRKKQKREREIKEKISRGGPCLYPRSQLIINNIEPADGLKVEEAKNKMAAQTRAWARKYS